MSLLANGISMFLGMLAVIVLPKYLSLEQYGLYQLYLLYVGFTAMLALGVPEGIYLALGGKKKVDVDRRDVRFQFSLLAVLDLLVFFVIALFTCLTESDELRRATLLWVVLSGLINCVRNYPLFVLQATGKIREYSISVILERVISIVPIVTMVCIGFSNITFLLFFDVFGRAVSFVYVMAAFVKLDSGLFSDCCSDDVSVFTKLRAFLSQTQSGFQLMIASYASTAIIGIARIGVEEGWEFALFAQISLVISIANMLTRLINAVAIPIFPMLKDLSVSAIKVLYRNASFVITLAFLLLNVFVQPLVQVLAWWVPNYSEALGYVALLVPMCLFESKTAVLVMSLCKSLRREEILFAINVTSIALAALGTMLCVIFSDGIATLLVFLVVIMGVRCFAGEMYLYRTFSFRSDGAIIWDVVISCGICIVWCMRPSLLSVSNVMVPVLFSIANRKKILSIANNFWDMKRSSR
ncbi:hypothetical protein [Adlercreutzia sp. ZJ473]|uniref:hypothetical protein n=1 Tax=Adlercreutzia sp. ZJ473 TaxID=2722822 RepID=UPI0015533610|nr:hypothetical protein [Adlercreutzia sp. ZJ473]